MNLRSAIWIFASLAVGLSLVSGPPVRAQQTSFKIGVLDVQRVLRQSAATKSIRPQLEEIKLSYQAEVRKQEKALRAANQDLLRQRAILAPEAYDRRRKKFARLAGQAQRSLQNSKRSIDVALGRARSKVHRALMRIAREIATERTFSLVLPRSAILVVEKKLDITAEVIKRLNERLPSVAIDLPKIPSDKKK